MTRDRMKCPECGISFRPHRHGQVYCGPDCKKSAANKRENASHRAARAAARGSRTCPECGKVFTPKSSLAVYCSRRCCLAKFRKSRKETVEVTPKPPQAPTPPSAAERESRVRAYLALPPSERWARREELTPEEHRLAMKMWDADHPCRCVSVNLLV